jgi:GNAT superfamily N-acetyltransferase
MSSTNFAVRRMTEGELGVALDWATEEGWNPGLDDAESFFAADPDGFLLGELGGEKVGCISAVCYGGNFGFLGLYLVRAPFRGRGYGMTLWRAAMAHLGARNVGLDGVVAQQENYRKSGFGLAYRNIRYEGVGGGTPHEGLIELASVAFADVVRYDRTIFPADREEFVRCWIRQKRGAALAVAGANGIRGYGVLRACRRGYRIGPLFADDPLAAERLFCGLAACVVGEPIFLDTPNVNPAAIALAKKHSMAPVFETARMYTGAPPRVRLDACYGVTTFELG